MIVAVIRKIPPNKLLQPGLQIGCGLVPEFPPGQAYIRVRERNVAVSRHVHEILLRLHLQMPLQDADKCRHGHR